MSRLPPALFALLLLLPAPAARAQGPPPALVVTTVVHRATMAPQSTFVGTVRYPEIAAVAAEARGRVAAVHFEEGQRIAAGAPLVDLDAAVLRKEIEALQASRAQAAAEAERARLEAERYEVLFGQATVSRQEYDNVRYTFEALQHRTEALAAQIAAFQVQLNKKIVRAPFAGVILERQADRGEWLEEGDPVATLARDDEIDILVSVPEEVTGHLSRGLEVAFEAAGHQASGRVEAVIPRGDIRTRSFPVKLRADNALGLLDGMEAQVRLPSAAAREVFSVPRDALASAMGRTVVYLVVEGQARSVEVEVVAYQGTEAGVLGEGLSEGAAVVTKGNERLRDGQPVRLPAEQGE